MTMLNGPTRMVVLDAGKYDFADIDLTKPLHLIGPNNIGKTSLISMLQFLYIDKQNQMEFSSDLRTSRRYYFPNSSSYILFEVHTPSGFMVVGIHGLGPVKQHEFERFCYRGTLDVEDYLNDGTTIRDADIIRTTLSSKEYKKLEPNQLREILVGSGASGIDLGMLPIRQRKQYEPFRTLFKKLLNLAHLRQDELKDAFLQIHGSDLQQREVDLSGNYGEQYQQFVRKKRDIEDLQKSQPMIESALESTEKRAEARSRAAALWGIIQTQYADEKERKLHDRSQFETRKVEHKAEHTHFSDERDLLYRRREALREPLSRWVFKLEELADLERNLSDFVLDIEEAKRQKLKSEIEHLANSLIGSKKSPEALNEQLELIQKKRTHLTNLIENSADVVANRLQGQIDEQSLESIFKLLNPEIIHLKCGESIHIDNMALAISSLKEIQSNIEGAEFSAQGITIDLSSLNGPGLDKLKDPIRLRTLLQSAENEHAEVKASIVAARDRQQLEKTIKALEDKRDAITIKISDWNKYQQKLAQKNDWLKEKRDCKKSIDWLKDELGKMDECIEQTRIKLEACDSASKALTRELTSLDESIRKINTPDDAWIAMANVKGSATLNLNITEYDEAFHAAMNFHQQVCEARKIIESMTYDRFSFGDESVWIKAMKEEIEGLNKKEEAVNLLWHGIIAGMQKDFKALKHDLEMMRSHITSFNKAIAKFNVSNLTMLKIKINPRGNLTAPIEKLIDEQETP